MGFAALLDANRPLCAREAAQADEWPTQCASVQPAAILDRRVEARAQPSEEMRVVRGPFAPSNADETETPVSLTAAVPEKNVDCGAEAD
jgi:hypothetical protein